MRNPLNNSFWKKLWQQQGGFTLLEVVAAVFIAGTSVVGSVVLLGTAVRSASTTSGGLDLQQLVQAQIETIQQSSFIKHPTEPPTVSLTAGDTYPVLTDNQADVTVTFEEEKQGVNVAFPLRDDLGEPTGTIIAFFIGDAGTNYQFPNPDGAFITNVVQRIDVTASHESTSVIMSFYKISVP